MKPKSKNRRRRRMAGLALMALALMAAALPLWFPWLLRPVLNTQGVRFDRYERLGLLRFALVNVRSPQAGARFAAARVETALPPVWLWHRLFGAGHGPPGPALLMAEDWRLEFKRAATDPPGAQKAQGLHSTAEVLDQIESFLPGLRAWLPAARLTNGLMVVEGREVGVPWAEWGQGRLAVRLLPADWKQQVSLETDFSSARSPLLKVRVAPLGLLSTMRWTSSQRHWDLQAEIQWEQNQARVDGRFERDSWWPAQARLEAPHIILPARRLHLDGYQEVSGSVAAQWDQGRFEVTATADARPLENGLKLRPPVRLEARARGDTETARLEQLRINTPWLEAWLSEEVVIERSGRMLSGDASLRMGIDLAQLPGSFLSGRLEGALQVRPGVTQGPRVEFQVSGSGLSGGGLEAETLSMEGFAAWPRLVMETAQVRFADGSTWAGLGGWDLQSGELLNGQWRFEGGALRRFLPEEWSYGHLNASGNFSGPLTNVVHSGEVDVSGLSVPQLKPLRGRVRWSGAGRRLASAEAEMLSGQSAIRLAGEVQMGRPPDWTSLVQWATLTFQRGDEILYDLQTPCALAFGRDASRAEAAPGPWQISLDNFHCAGPNRLLTLSASVRWPQSGRVSGRMRGLVWEDLADFLAGTPQEITLNEVTGRAEWDHGPVAFDLGLAADFKALDDRRFSARVEMRGGDAGLTVEKLLMADEHGPVVSGRGTLPLAFLPHAGPKWLRLDFAGPVSLSAATERNPDWWRRVGAWTGVEVREAQLQLDVKGSLGEPQGRLNASAQQVDWKGLRPRWAWLSASNLHIAAEFQKDSLEVRRGQFEVQGQPVQFTGFLPWPQALRSGDFSRSLQPDWSQARARLSLEDLALAPLAAQISEVLAPEGRLNAQVALEPGLKVAGQLRVTNAATRPLPALGPIRDLGFRLAFSQDQATLQSLSATVAGRAVTATGQMKFPDMPGLAWDVQVGAQDVPLLRQPGLVVRSDVDLRCVRTNGTALLTGALQLRNSLLVRELKLLPSQPASSALGRAPYFSITQALFADWKLDLNVGGDRFLRVQSPVLRGELSAAFHLTGTLADPRASGEARLDSGWIQFPFGNLRVEQGSASLTAASPDQPQLLLAAASRFYGYDVRMELSGPLDEPMASFSAMPPLRSEEIVLMLTTGEPPRRLATATTTQRAGNLAVFLGRDWLHRLGVAEDGAERLTIRSGEEVSEQGGLTYSAEYRLLDNWSLVAEYDRFNAFNAGLKWRVYSK